MELVLGSDMLHKVDSMSMAHGLEVREPFLDYRLVEFVMSLPSAFKVTGMDTKFILKEAYKNDLPTETLTKKKHGFDVPMTALFTKELKNWIINELLEEKFIENQHVFKLDYIKKIREAINKNSIPDNAHVWSIVVFQFWWKKYMMQ